MRPLRRGCCPLRGAALRAALCRCAALRATCGGAASALRALFFLSPQHGKRAGGGGFCMLGQLGSTGSIGWQHGQHWGCASDRRQLLARAPPESERRQSRRCVGMSVGVGAGVSVGAGVRAAGAASAVWLRASVKMQMKMQMYQRTYCVPNPTECSKSVRRRPIAMTLTHR